MTRALLVVTLAGAACEESGSRNRVDSGLLGDAALTDSNRDDGPAVDVRGADAASIDALELVASVSHHGISWTFDQPARVGQFINGDYYVVGPITVVALSPAPLLGDQVPEQEIGERERGWRPDGQFVRNGFMLNPPADLAMSYDSAIRNYFRPALIQQLPVSLEPGDSLVSTISIKVGEIYPTMLRDDSCWREEGDCSPLRTAAVLTCVAEPQPADAFRPAFVATEKRRYLGRDLKRGLLPQISCPPSSPDPDEMFRIFERTWLNTGWFGFDNPLENMPRYGREIGRAMGLGGLLLACDHLTAEQREALLVHMVQVGIDYWGMIEGGHGGWEAWGGHHSGRKFAIVLAGLLLGDDAMASPTVTYPEVSFQEDEQTGYGESWTGAGVVFLGHSGVNTKTGQPARPKWGPYEHLHPSSWNEDNITSESYRRCCSSLAWVGQALLMRMLRAEESWAHDAWFAYVDRWMGEDDSAQVQAILQSTGENYSASWARQGQCWDGFIEELWASYRDSLP